MKKQAMVCIVTALHAFAVSAAVVFEDGFDGAVHGYDAGYTGAEGDNNWCDFANRAVSDSLTTASTGESVLQVVEDTVEPGRIQIRSAFDVGLDASQFNRITIRLRMDADGNGLYDDALAPNDFQFWYGASAWYQNNANIPVIELVEDTIEEDGGNGWQLITINLDPGELSGDFRFIRIDMDGLDAAGRAGEIDYLKIESVPVDPPPERPQPAAGAPNIIYIICDDLGYSDIGCYGSEIDTPNIDALASEGLIFSQHYTYAKCETSRAALMSGMYHHKAGLGIKGEAKTIGEVLWQGGYKSYITGKWHLLGNPVSRGFDGFYGLPGGSSSHFDPFSQGLIYRDNTQLTSADRPSDFYTSDYFASEAIAYIQQSKQEDPDRPFFLYLAFTAPHSPIQAPAGLVAKYRHTYTNGWDQIRAARVARQRELGIFSEAWSPSVRNEDIPAWDTLDPALQDAEDFRMAAYAAMVERVDWNVGRVLDAIGTNGLNVADNTLIYFVSDNGSSPYPRTSSPQVLPDAPNSQWRIGPAWAWVGNTPYRYYKQSQFNGGVLTPMVVRWPSVITNAGSVVDYPTHLIDVMATLTDVAGVDYATNFPAAPSLDGISIRSIFEGGPEPARPPVGFEFGGRDFAFLDYPWKISSYRREPWQLFNLETDRAETLNLARENESKVAELATAFQGWVDQRNLHASSTFTGMEPDTSAYVGREERYRDPLTTVRGEYSYDIPPVWSKDAVGDVTVFDAAENGDTGQIETTLDGARIGGIDDDFGFMNRSFVGDGEMVVKVVSFTDCGANARAGVMLRESLDDDSAFVLAEVNRNGASSDPTVNLRYRAATGDSAVLLSSGIESPLPIWVRLERDGDLFAASYSTDGRHYIDYVQTNLNLNAAVRSGIAVCSQLTSSTGMVAVTDYEQTDSVEYAERDADGDGINELQQYAFGLNLGSPNERGMEIGLNETNVLQVSHVQRIDGGGLTYRLQVSGNMIHWVDDVSDWQAEGGSVPLADGLTERVFYSRNGEPEPVGYLRVSVTESSE